MEFTHRLDRGTLSKTGQGESAVVSADQFFFTLARLNTLLPRHVPAAASDPNTAMPVNKERPVARENCPRERPRQHGQHAHGP
jgi:hypothetical protein